MSSLSVSKFIKHAALSVGFDACGLARAELLEEDAVFLKRWLDEGRQGEMHYLARNFVKRTDPRELVDGCKTVVVVLLNYFSEGKQPVGAPLIARYAWPSVDYHLVVKAKLNELERKIREAYGEDVVSSEQQHSFVDSAPVLERRWAERAGLGWIGKNTQLIHPGLGSYCFIGILMLNLEAEYDRPVRARCGACTRCMDACPTRALDGAVMDARRCLSYLTIEHKNPVPEEFQSRLSGCALGCDICAEVCPWNKMWAKPHRCETLVPSEVICKFKAEDWQNLSKSDFDRLFKKSAMKRAGYEKLMQNIGYVKREFQ